MRCKLEVNEFTNADEDRWDRYVLAHQEGTFFHLSAWRRILEDEFGCKSCYRYVERNGDIIGILPLFHVRNFIAGNVLISTPFLVYGGPIGEDDSICDLLTEAATELAELLQVDYLELRSPRPVSGDWLRSSLYVTFRRKLEPDIEANLLAIPRKQRAMVRKGVKAETEVSWDHELERFYRVFSESYRNLGTPVFPISFFRRILEAFGEKVWLTTISHDGQPLTSVMSFTFRNEVLPYYGGGVAGARYFAANDLMYWLVMERAVESGIQIFDYGRSKVGTGSYSFKKHWGFEPEELSYQYHLVKAKQLPNLSPTNPKFKLPIEIWKKLPVGLSRLIGPAIARRLA